MLKIFRLPAVLLILSLLATTCALAQAPHSFPFRATNYDVEVILHPEDQTIQGQANVDFVAEQVAKTVLVELHPDLHVTSVKMAGQPVTFARDNNAPLLLTVALPSTATPGKQITLTFDYSGPVSSEEDSPTKGIRFASVEKTAAYLLLPARWFPLTNYPSNRYTGKFNLIVPSSFAVTGTGKADPPTTQPGIGGAPNQTSYVFHCDQPGPVGSFVAGNLQLSPAPTEGYQFSFYTPPAQASTVASYAGSLAQIMSYFSETFGPLSAQQAGAPSLTVAQLPDGSLAGYSAPGLLLISARQWTSKANDRLLSQLAAGQWWGDRVLPATGADAWITDGLSRYAEAMYAEQSGGVAQLNKALEDFAVGALMFEDATPISQADRIGAYSDPYLSIVADKGAMVFHMLRAQLGDDGFTALLREFYKQHVGKTATIESFERMTATKAPPAKAGEPPLNLVSFFSQWLNSTGVPEFTLQYIVYRTPKGFQVVGTVHQDLDTFRMPVEVKVDTEGNPEFKKILVTGTTSQFKLETFGRPKPNGISIDPNNNLLKSSPRLRVHATIARGEGLATLGKYYEAIQEYQRALDVQPTNSLAHFRMGEAMFYQKNYQAAANAFRAALGGDLDPKWTEVWGHIYMGKIYDLLGQRERAVNEYNLAQHSKDDTAGAQSEAARYMRTPYNPDSTAPPATVTASGNPAQVPAAAAADSASDKQPTLKKRTDSN
ncbi:MAG TPA: M1 family aminopeptidase [Candidatus Acidoferrales bacterium]|nr:M1 family aminopeptidase [Candidatus Acidoferrales bacterium]